MARRRKSKETGAYEAVTSLIGVGLLFYFISPDFRSAIQILLLVIVIIALVALAIWLLCKFLKNEQPSTAFKEASRPENSNAENQLSHKPPPIGGKKSYNRPVPELDRKSDL